MQISSFTSNRTNFNGLMYIKNNVALQTKGEDSEKRVGDMYINSDEISTISDPYSDSYASLIRMKNGDSIYTKYPARRIAAAKLYLDTKKEDIVSPNDIKDILK